MKSLQKIIKPFLMAVIATFCFIFAGVAQNMITNPGFEDWTGGKPDGWFGAETHTTGLTVAQSDIAHEGSSSCQLIVPSTTQHRRFTSKPLNVVAGQEYTVTFWVRGSGDVRTGFYSGQGSGVGDNYKYNDYIAATGTWTQHTQTVTAPATSSEAELIFSVRSTTGDHILIDDVEMTESGDIPLIANFTADLTLAAVGATINFTDLSTGEPRMWDWTITGPETMTSTLQNPSFTFTKEGSYDVTLEVFADDDEDRITKAKYILIGDFILVQDFSSGFGDWETVSVIGEQQWIISSNGGPDNSPCAQINGYSGGNNANEAWLISPAISEKSIIFSFDNAYNFAGDALELFVSTDYDGDVAEATWSKAVFTLSTGSYNWVNSGDISYTHEGEKVHIAFKYTSTTSDGSLWRVDNILVKSKGEQGIAETPNFQYEIYPNPSSTGVFNIKTEGSATIKAFSIDGRMVKEQTMTNETTLDMSSCSKGIFLLQIIMENGATATQKVVIK